jgi:transketolase
MDFKPSTIRTLSILGQRGAFGFTLTEIAKEIPDIVALSADLCNTSGLDRFRTAFSERFYNVGIAEQNMIGISAGLAAGGNIPFATTFSNFAALRSCEQVRHFLGYMKENVKIVGFGSGFAMGMFGITHYGIEDIASIRAINNITILSPADGLETAKVVIAAAKTNAPVYIRLSGIMNNPMVYKEDYDFEIGKAITLKEGKDIAIIATGTMVYNSLKAAEFLEEQGVSTKVVNMHTIKPIDCSAIADACNTKLIVTVEEHSKIGGLGSAVAEELSLKTLRPPHYIIGVNNEYKHAGSYEYLIEQYGLTAEQIYKDTLLKYKGV